MNQVHLMGRVTRDVELKQSVHEVKYVRFTLAVNEGGKVETTNFIEIVAFERRAETLAEYAKKGTKLCIRGHLTSSQYTNKEGSKQYSTSVVLEDFEFAESKKTREDVAVTIEK